MKKIQVEGVTGAVFVVAGLATYFLGGGNVTNAFLGAAGAAIVTMVVVSIYNAMAR